MVQKNWLIELKFKEIYFFHSVILKVSQKTWIWHNGW